MTTIKTPTSPEVLKQHVEKIERLEEEKADIAADINDIYQCVKSDGFDVKVVRQIIKLRKLEESQRKEYEALIDLYMSTLEGSK